MKWQAVRMVANLLGLRTRSTLPRVFHLFRNAPVRGYCKPVPRLSMGQSLNKLSHVSIVIWKHVWTYLIGQKICRRRLGLPHRPAAWAQLKTAVGPWPNPGYPVTWNEKNKRLMSPTRYTETPFSEHTHTRAFSERHPLQV